MSRLSDISASPVLREFAQGAAQSAIMPVADFLAPTIEVPTSVGRYKKYTEKDRFRIPNTLRSIGGRATELRFEVSAQRRDQRVDFEPEELGFRSKAVEERRPAKARGSRDLFDCGAAVPAMLKELERGLLQQLLRRPLGPACCRGHAGSFRNTVTKLQKRNY